MFAVDTDGPVGGGTAVTLTLVISSVGAKITPAASREAASSSSKSL